jgi:penicillin amidase
VTAGLPGVVIGRNDHVAFGVTNAYADTVDLYIERLDPDRSDHYLEGEVSIPFDIVTERIRISDPASEKGYRDVTLDIRFTRRGPVISDHREELGDEAVLSLRWASAEYLGDTLGLDTLMLASNVDEALESVSNTNIVSLNFVVGDTSGRVARHASGAAPKRLSGDGMVPFVVTDGVDNWGGRIPAVNMPGEVDPKHGWTGSANHMTAPADYPWVYTTYASPTYRYQRIKELLSAPRVTAERCGQHNTTH